MESKTSCKDWCTHCLCGTFPVHQVRIRRHWSVHIKKETFRALLALRLTLCLFSGEILTEHLRWLTQSGTATSVWVTVRNCDVRMGDGGSCLQAVFSCPQESRAPGSWENTVLYFQSEKEISRRIFWKLASKEEMSTAAQSSARSARSVSMSATPVPVVFLFTVSPREDGFHL